MSTHTRRVLVPMSDAHYEWLRAYANSHSMSIDAVVRAAIRVHNMLHLTPGAFDAIAALQPCMPLFGDGDSCPA